MNIHIHASKIRPRQAAESPMTPRTKARYYEGKAGNPEFC